MSPANTLCPISRAKREGDLGRPVKTRSGLLVPDRAVFSSLHDRPVHLMEGARGLEAMGAMNRSS